MAQADRSSLRRALAGLQRAPLGSFHDPKSEVALAGAIGGSNIHGGNGSVAGRTVLLAAKEQLASGLALLAMDGVAKQIVLCPPDLSSAHRTVIAQRIGVDLIVTDLANGVLPGLETIEHLRCASSIVSNPGNLEPNVATDWVLLTSGTSGPPKAVRHTLATLTGAILPASVTPETIVWSTFYDIRRYGGLQIFLRAVLGGHSLVLSHHDEPMLEFLARVGAAGATHVTGTPSHWRSALMTGSIGTIAPSYVRLSGEIASKVVLDGLKTAFPHARIVHAFASTEAGVAFEVTDGLEGFPADYVGNEAAAVAMRVVDGSLRIRSPRAAIDYVGEAGEPLKDAEGYVDTGDMVELRDGRFFFTGRRGGIINVGGAKVHPEEVEGVINRHPGVSISLVKARPNPIMGAIVAAEIVLKGAPASTRSPEELDTLRAEITALCQAELAAHKVPLSLRFVAALALTPAGKLVRSHA